MKVKADADAAWDARANPRRSPSRDGPGQQEVERLRSESEQQQSILEECLAHIDQSILTCRAQIDEYRQTRSDLVALNERLVNLGAESVAVPDHLPAKNLEDLILACLQRLSAKGRS